MDYGRYTTDELASMGKRGDKGAENELFKTLDVALSLQIRVKKVISDPEDARDIVQDTLTTAYEKYCSMNNPKPGFDRYVLEILWNKIGNHFQKTNVRGRHAASTDQNLAIENLPGLSADPEQNHLYHKCFAIVTAQTDHFEDIMRLRYEGYSVNETSQMLGISAPRVYRIRDKGLSDFDQLLKRGRQWGPGKDSVV